MKKRILLIIGAVVLVLIVCFMLSERWAILPVKSTAKTLTLVNYGFKAEQITISNYIDDELVCDYTLDVDLYYQMPVEYELPELTDGCAVVSVKYNETYTLQTEYESAADLYNNGLLIYFWEDSSASVVVDRVHYPDRYIYFISTGEQECFAKKGISTEWLSCFTSAPKRLVHKDPMMIYSYPDSWEKGEWQVHIAGE